jgi:tetratricopeptide (TPR) repeat protein
VDQVIGISEQSLMASIADAEKYEPAQLPGALTNLARFYRNAGRTSDAEALYASVVDRMRDSASEDSQALANSLSNLAVVYQDQGKFAQAESNYQEALQLRQASGDYPATAATLVNLAQLYQDAGDERNAASTLAQVKSLWESEHAVNDSQAAAILCELAAIREEAGDTTEVDALYAQAIELWEGDAPRDRKSAQLLMQLAERYRGKSDDANAARSYRLVVAGWQTTGAVSQAATAAAHLGELYQARSEYSRAEQMDRQALELSESIVGQDALELAATVSSVAIILNLEGKLAEAAPFYRRALQIRQTHLGAQHPDVIQSIQFYALCLRNMGKLEEAAEMESGFKPVREVRNAL